MPLTDATDTSALADTLAALRRGQHQTTSRKVVIIIDQFEQWLHAHPAEPDAELVKALRQCDGSSLQAILMVRDDFAMAAARFMDVLDVPILQGQNFKTVDLFDIDHAQKVLIQFGQAFGKLPANAGNLSSAEQQFVSTVAMGLAQNDKVVSVRVALFAEMVKSKPWTMATLDQVGGTQGIGVNFLEETFSSPQANPNHRRHAAAARAVLKSLLPDVGTDIKGHMRSQQELLEASGYADRPLSGTALAAGSDQKRDSASPAASAEPLTANSDFTNLLRILDGELRLITPTDPEGDSLSGSASSPGSSPSALRFYQLTHDYLVPSLREWLTKKQKETRKGRAELKLEERTALWTAKPENRHLPSLAEWTAIRTLTDRAKWNPLQKAVMRRATRVHGSRLLLGFTASVLLIVGGLWTKSRVDERQAQTSAGGLVAALLSAETRDVPRLVSELAPFRQWADPQLQAALESADTKTQLHARIALLPVDSSQVDPLQTALLDTTPENVLVIREVLHANGDSIPESYWRIPESTDYTNQQRLAAAAALARLAPDDDRWTGVVGPLSRMLVNENPLRLTTWIEAFRPVRQQMIPELGVIFRGQSKGVTPTQRELATNILETYAADNIQELTALMLDAQPTQFAALFDEFAAFGSVARDKMADVIDREPVRPPMWENTIRPLLEEHPVRNSDRALIKAADGMLTDDFAFVQTMTRPAFEKVTKSLAESGYRPTQIRPSWINDSLNIAAVWHRDGRKFVYSFDHSVESLTDFDESQRQNAMIPADIAGYIDQSSSPPAERYVGLWESGTAETSGHELFVGERESEYSTRQYAHKSYQLFQGLTGERIYSGIKQSGASGSNAPTDTAEVKQDQVPYQTSVIGVESYDPSEATASVAELTEKLITKPDDWSLLLRRARAHMRSGDVQSALNDLNAVLALQPLCTPATRERLICHVTLKNHDQAGKDFEQLKSMHLGDWECRFFEQLLTETPDFQSLFEPLTETRIDLLRTIDVTRHSASGSWSRIDNVIQSPRGVAKLNVPVVPNSPYRLHLLVSPTDPPEGKSNGALILGVIRGDKRFYVELDGGIGTFIELEGQTKAAGTTARLFSPNQITAIDIHVSDDRVTVSADGTVVLDWETAAVAPATKPFWETSEFCLTFCSYESNYRFLNAVLELEGDPKCEFRETNAQQENRLLESSVWAEFANQPVLAEKLATTFFQSMVKQTGKTRSDVDRKDVQQAFSLLKPPIDSQLAAALTRVLVGTVDDYALEGKWTKPMGLGDHVSECLDFAEADYVPVAIDVTSVAGSVVASSVWQRKTISNASINHLARQKSNAVTALARLNDRQKLFSGLRVTDNPESLTQFVHRCRDSGITTSELLELLKAVEESRQSLDGESRRIEDRVLFGLLLALGEFSLSDVPEAERTALVDNVADWFAHDPSSAIHGATGWLLRQWGQTEIVTRVDQTPVPYDPGREWFTLAIEAGDRQFYQTYVVIPPGEYEIGSFYEAGRGSNEKIHRVRLTRPVAILDREVTRGEFEASRQEIEEYSPTADHPMVAPSWYDSVQYCRWWTARAGLSETDQAYADPRTLNKNAYPLDSGSGFPKNWPIDLAKPGFRLPTEAEWEIAARSGMRSMYGFGADESLLERYGWYEKNSNHQKYVAKALRPNFGGLFDMHGNVFEWCHDWYGNYGPMSTRIDPTGNQLGTSRVVRGGSWSYGASNCRTANRSISLLPTVRTSNYGFRLALTLRSGRSSEAKKTRTSEPGGGGTEGARAEPRPEMP